MSSKGHEAMTGSGARVTAKVGGAFTAWDGYISGKTLELEKGRRIVQSWRTTEFRRRIRIPGWKCYFEKTKAGTKVTFVHTNIPAGQGEEYRKGWLDFYFKPMKEYFGSK